MALGILTLITVFIMGLFSKGSLIIHRSKAMTTALFLAQGKMEETIGASSPMRTQNQSGSFTETFRQYHYNITTAPYGLPGLKTITVEVISPTGEKVHLTSLKRTQVMAVAAGGYHSLAIKDDGTAWSWGNDSFGQLGNNNHALTVTAPAPVCELAGQVLGECVFAFTDAVAAAGGYHHSLLLKQNGTAWGFGRNLRGQIGDGAFADRLAPAPVLNCAGCKENVLIGVSSVSASISDDFSLALKGDGTVWAWGDDQFGQLGNNEMGYGVKHPAPVQVCEKPGGLPGSCGTVLSGITEIAAGGNHGLALKNDGTVWAWGRNNFGQLGNNASGPAVQSGMPVQVCAKTGPVPGTCSSYLSNIVGIDAGFNHGLALKNDGTVWAWGNNYLGYLGNNESGTTKYSPIAVQVCATPGSVPGICASYLRDVIAIAAGGYHGLALKGDGTVWAWGDNTFGQLGNNNSGVTNYRTVPVEVCSSPGSAPGRCAGYLRSIAAFSAGYYHNLVLTADGTIWGWGNNAYGQLGNGQNTKIQSVPVRTARF